MDNRTIEQDKRIKQMIIKRNGFLNLSNYNDYVAAFESALMADRKLSAMPESFSKNWQYADELLSNDEKNADILFA